MDKNINELLLNQESLGRIVETKFHELDNKVTGLTTTVNQVKQEVDAIPLPSSDDDGSPTLPVWTQFRTHARFASMPTQDVRPLVFAPAATSTMHPLAPPMSTPPAQRTSVEAFADALLLTPSTTVGVA
ncbi:hypothetical protein D1007_36020 [Hordeum vulgare]|nr:hypothetical protein D1007_36020 [Hordeum vulgare]